MSKLSALTDTKMAAELAEMKRQWELREQVRPPLYSARGRALLDVMPPDAAAEYRILLGRYLANPYRHNNERWRPPVRFNALTHQYRAYVSKELVAWHDKEMRAEWNENMKAAGVPYKKGYLKPRPPRPTTPHVRDGRRTSGYAVKDAWRWVD